MPYKKGLGKYLMNRRLLAVLPFVHGRLLDIGCGINALVKNYSGNGVGVDVYEWDGVDVVVKDAAMLPFKDESFDTVTIIATLNHIPNREAVLREAHRVLSDNGRLVVTSIYPRISRLWHAIRKPWDMDQHERGMHHEEVYGFTKKELRALVRNAGFSIEQETSFNYGINQLISSRKN